MDNGNFKLTLDETQANAILEKGVLYADAFVNKNYLINLERYPLVALDPAEKSDEYVRLYQIERIVYDVNENANDKLISVYSAFFNIQAAGLLVIHSTRDELGFYIGVRSVDKTSTAEAILEKSFKGNFAGSQIHAIPQKQLQKVLGGGSIEVDDSVLTKMSLRFLSCLHQEMKIKSILYRASKSSLTQ